MAANEMIPALRLMTRGAYALQKLRIQTGLRLCANFRDKLKESGEIAADADDEELSEKAQKIIDVLKADYRRLTEGVARNRTLPRREGFVGEGVISDFTELVLVHQYEQLERQEREHFRHIGEALESLPIWTDWLEGQRGIGPAMGAVLVTSFDVHKAVRPSQFWAIAGLDVGPGIATDPDHHLARSRRKEHLVEREYKARDGSTKKKMSTTFDPWLQSRMLGVLGGSLLRSSSPYRKHYDQYRHRIETDPNRRKGTLADKKKDRQNGIIDESIWHPLRIHRASMRYMVKYFIADFWRAWREIEGLPVVPWYHEAKQGGHTGRSESSGPSSQAAE
jgi:hypothetical protein